MRHRRRVSLAFSVPTTTTTTMMTTATTTGTTTTIRLSYSDFTRALRIGGRQYLLPLSLYLYSSLNVLFIELTRNRGIHRRLTPISADLSVPGMSDRDYAPLRRSAELTCDKLAFLIRIFEQSINVTSIRWNLWRTRSHAIATYFDTDRIGKLDLIILSTSSMSF